LLLSSGNEILLITSSSFLCLPASPDYAVRVDGLTFEEEEEEEKTE
jgi:hypothetical protein